MNRAEKRHMDRLEIWFNSLSEDKKQKIYDIINERIDSNNNIMSTISDICTVSALDDVLNISISDIKNVISKSKSYMVDYGEYLEREKNGGIKMIENEELRKKVKVKISQYMNGKMDKAKGLKLLKREFNLPMAELSDLWLECKSGNEGYSKSKNMPDTKMDYIEPDEDNVVISINNIKEDKDLTRQDITIINTPLYDNRIILKPNSNLRIVSVTTQVEGLYGAYTRNIEGVRTGDKLYTDKDMVKNEKVAIITEYKSRKDDIRDKIKALNIELKDVEILEIKEIEMFAELESVFDL